MRILSILFAACFAVCATAAEIRLPEEALVNASTEDGKSWNQCGTMELTYAAAKKTFGFSLRKQGWVKQKSFDYDRIQWKSLEIWERGAERILVQFWREDISRTGFAWGVLKDETKR